MTDIHEQESWSTQLDVTPDDLKRVAEQLEQAGTPQELKKIALSIIQERMEQGHDLVDQRPEDILSNYGEHLLRRLAEALEADTRFTSLEGKWFITTILPPIKRDTLQELHRILLQKPTSSIEELLPLGNEDTSADRTLLRMAVQSALLRLPERFENIGTPAHPQWKARLPDVEQAEVTHYAYDPHTYEVLCRPGQKLSQKKGQRLRELNLYAHVVTFAK